MYHPTKLLFDECSSQETIQQFFTLPMNWIYLKAFTSLLSELIWFTVAKAILTVFCSASILTKLFPRLSGMNVAAQIMAITPMEPYIMHTPDNEINLIKSWKTLIVTNPQVRVRHWHIPIEEVLISVGNNSFMSVFITGKIPPDLMIIWTVIEAKGIHPKYCNVSDSG